MKQWYIGKNPKTILATMAELANEYATGGNNETIQKEFDDKFKAVTTLTAMMKRHYSQSRSESNTYDIWDKLQSDLFQIKMNMNKGR